MLWRRKGESAEWWMRPVVVQLVVHKGSLRMGGHDVNGRKIGVIEV